MRHWVMGLLACALTAHGAAAQDGSRRPVQEVGPARVAVGAGMLPAYVSQDWSRPQPGVTRAVLVLHGYLRNAQTYYRTALAAQRAAGPAGRGSLMIAPQFLEAPDIAANGLAEDTLRWPHNAWEGGEDALGPAPVSSFEALDAILRLLANRQLFPNLKAVVVAGHSGGAQVVQRYAIAGKAEPALAAAGIAVRFVVANPSSYAYFDAKRPVPPVNNSCPRFNEWKYGMDGRAPYLAGAAPGALLDGYLRRDVVYLLGGLDKNPNHPALDKSCMAEAQGPTRLDRGQSYFATMLTLRPGAMRQHLVEVPGVGHDGDGMFTSPCGLAALFGTAGCGLP